MFSPNFPAQNNQIWVGEGGTAVDDGEVFAAREEERREEEERGRAHVVLY